MNLPKKQGQRLIPEYLLNYSEELHKNHPDPSAEWGGGSGGTPIEAGDGIEITGVDVKTISIDNTVALKSELFSGDYNDLSNKPTIPTATSDLTNDSGFITSSALTGYATENYVDTEIGSLSIPTKTSDLTNDSGFITGITSSDVTTALGYTPGTSNFSGDYDDLTDKPDLSIYAESSDLATVATSGSYNDLIDKPTIPSIPVVTIDTQGVGVISGSITQDQYNTLLNNPEAILVLKGYVSSTSEMYLRQVQNTTYTSDLVYQTQILGVAGSYGYGIITIQSNLTWTLSDDSFTIPTVNDAAITITQGGVTKGLFTLNQSTNQTIDVDDVPGMIGEVIFSTTPTSGVTTYPINLTKNITQYDYIEVYYNVNDDTIQRWCQTFPNPAVGNRFNLTCFGNGTTRLYTKNSCFEIATTTSLALINSAQQRVGNNEATTVGVSTTQFHCRPYKIIGYKQNSAPIVIPTVPVRSDNLISVSSGFANRYTKVMYDQQNGLLTLVAQWYNNSGTNIAANTTIATVDSSITVPFNQYYYPGLNQGNAASIKLELATGGTIKNIQSWTSGTTLTVSWVLNIS